MDERDDTVPGTHLGIFELELRDGIQLFPIDYNVLDDTSIKNKIKAFKIIIKSTYGSDKTYINKIKVYLIDDCSEEKKIDFLRQYFDKIDITYHTFASTINL